MGNDDEAVEFLQRKRDEVVQQLERLDAALAALRGNGRIELKPGAGKTESVIGPIGGVVPPIVDICRYLKQTGRPTHQNDIIRTIGNQREQRYPTLTNHYSNIWRALEYHVRHNRLICCVHPLEGYVVPLKALPPRPKAKKLPNAPGLYEQENWFVLTEEIVEGKHIPLSAKGQVWGESRRNVPGTDDRDANEEKGQEPEGGVSGGGYLEG